MGLRGPIQNPHSIRGERAQRGGAAKVASPSAGPSSPAWLSGEALAIWKTTLRDLLAAGMVLQKVDGEALASYCDMVAQARELSALAGGESNPTAKLKYLRLAKSLRKDALLFADRLGLSPASRLRLGIKPEPPPTPMDEKWAAVLKR